MQNLMRSKSALCFKRYLSLFLSFVLVFCLIGCSPRNNQNSDNSEVEIEDEESPEPSEDIEEPEEPEDPRISDDGKPIYDFDEFVNGEMYREYAENSAGVDAYFLHTTELAKDRMKDIFDTTDLSDLGSDSGLYKVISLYRSLLSEDIDDEKLSAASSYIGEIEAVQSLDDLYELYSMEEYASINNLVRFLPWYAPNGYYVNVYCPASSRAQVNYYRSILDDPYELNLRKALNDIGYEDDRISEIFDNAEIVCGWVEDYLKIFNSCDTVDLYTTYNITARNLNVPLLDILDSLDGLGAANGFMAEKTFDDFLKEVYIPENLPLIRDYMLISSFWILSYIGYDISIAGLDQEYDTDNFYLSTILYFATDVVADEYLKRYGSDLSSAEVNSFILSLKTSAVKIVSDIDWLSEDTKELAKQKISRIGQYIGQNGHRNLLADYELTGNAIDDIIALSANSTHFERIQTSYSFESRAPYGPNLLKGSSFYIQYLNCIVITPYELCDPLFTGATTDEERLGYLGWTIAHEIGHSSDKTGIDYTYEGIYETIVSEDDMESYQEHLDMISNFFDGRETYFGNTIDGANIVNESYADLFAISVCLNILSEKENPDYDLFFRTYAKAISAYYTEGAIGPHLIDTHLMAKDRINLILGQFQEFYDTYNIDEDSPYFVPEDERLDIFRS